MTIHAFVRIGSSREGAVKCNANGALEAARPRLHRPKARDIAEARAQAAESGTCSALDVYNLGRSPAQAIADPLSPNELEKAFGTETPTLAEIDAGLRVVYAGLQRGAGRFLLPAHRAIAQDPDALRDPCSHSAAARNACGALTDRRSPTG